MKSCNDPDNVTKGNQFVEQGNTTKQMTTNVRKSFVQDNFKSGKYYLKGLQRVINAVIGKRKMHSYYRASMMTNPNVVSSNF